MSVFDLLVVLYIWEVKFSLHRVIGGLRRRHLGRLYLVDSLAVTRLIKGLVLSESRVCIHEHGNYLQRLVVAEPCSKFQLEKGVVEYYCRSCI